MNYFIYDTATGKILSTCFSSYPEDVPLQAQTGQDFFLNARVFPGATHIIDHVPVVIPTAPPVPTPRMLIQAIIMAVQLHLDDTARTRNYDDILSLASYAGSTDPVFAAEGAAGIVWRDACWRYCYQALQDVDSGARGMPTPSDAVMELPAIIWPVI